jgi:hypothetical protein
MNYCKKMDSILVEKMNRKKPKTMRQIEDIWYEGYSESRNTHYHNSRYHFLYDEKVIMWSCAGKSLQNHTFIKNHST